MKVAENGLSAIEKVKEGNYDIILVDFQMPVLDVYTVTRHIREINNEIPHHSTYSPGIVRYTSENKRNWNERVHIQAL